MGSGAKYFLAILYIMNKQYNKAAKILEDLSFIAENLLDNPAEIIMIKAVYYYAAAMDKLNSHANAMYYITICYLIKK